MNSFADKAGLLSVEQARELNRIAKLTCEWEITSETEDDG